jgi:transposase
VCCAHARRKFFDLARLNKAPIALEAVSRTDALFAVEREINGKPPAERCDGLARFLDHGRLCMTNNAAERALLGIAIGRHNWTFAAPMQEAAAPQPSTP